MLRGENGGRRLTHVSVVQSLTKVGGVEIGKGFAQDVKVKLDSKTDPSNLRVIAFIQQTGTAPGAGRGPGKDHEVKITGTSSYSASRSRRASVFPRSRHLR